MNNKKLIAVILVLMMAFSLIACKSNSDNLTVMRLKDSSYLVLKESDSSNSVGHLVSLSFPDKLEEPPLGSLAEIEIGPEIRESYPPQADVIRIEKIEEETKAVITLDVAEELLWHLGTGAYLIDVRTEAEYLEGHVSGALLMPVDEIAKLIENEISDKEAVLLLYCRSGNRSARAAEAVRSLGYKVVIDAGGVSKYKKDLVTGADPGPLPEGY